MVEKECPEEIFAARAHCADHHGLWVDSLVPHPVMPKEKFIKQIRVKKEKLNLIDELVDAYHDDAMDFETVAVLIRGRIINEF